MRRPSPDVIVSAVLGLALGLQFIPYGRTHRNPPVEAEPAWTSPEVRALAVRACFDCHSNQTVWPWYSHVAPVSWAIQHHVDEGRGVLNFSEWSIPQREADEAAETVAEGEMPPANYVLFHPGARLSPAERRVLEAGLSAMPGAGRQKGGRGDE